MLWYSTNCEPDKAMGGQGGGYISIGERGNLAYNSMIVNVFFKDLCTCNRRNVGCTMRRSL